MPKFLGFLFLLMALVAVLRLPAPIGPGGIGVLAFLGGSPASWSEVYVHWSGDEDVLSIKCGL